MKLSKVLKRESPLLVAREAIWRAQRAWNKKRTLGRLDRPGHMTFRGIPYYQPDLEGVDGRSRALIITYADKIRSGRYPFLGCETAELGIRPLWNLDFVSGATWPTQRLEIRNCIRHDGSDVKVPYELSRLQFLPVLGKAHVLTGNDAYRLAAQDLLSHWIELNPAPLGVNWTIAMEAALRAMSICFLLNLLTPIRKNEQAWLATITRSLAQHLLYIEASLEFSHFLTSNHYLSDLVGLYCLSLFLEGKGMGERRSEYRHRIENEIMRQVYDDGGDYEVSTGYQVLVTQLFTTALLLMLREGAAPKPAFVERLRTMFRFLNTIASTSGELPHVGDCDDGRTELLVDDLEQMILYPVRERNSLRVPRLLGLGQRLFDEGAGDGADAAWYGLTDAKRGACPGPKLNPGSASRVEVLSRSGIAVMRHRSAELLFFAMPNGIGGKGSHTHNDKLSFVLRVAGKEILCDSGTGCYTRDLETRNHFRSTAAHNTLMIDGLEQNRIDQSRAGLFILGNEASVTPIESDEEKSGRFLRASHTGYRLLGLLHTRTIRVVSTEPAFVIEDEIKGDGVHRFELNLQLAPRYTAEITEGDKGISCHILGDPQVQLQFSGPAGSQASIRQSRVSRTYGTTVPTEKLCYRCSDMLPSRIVTYISWTDGNDAAGSHVDSTTQSTFATESPRGS
jgi:heparinase II/III-like protein